MEALYLLIPLSVLAIFAAAWIFLRMSDSGQFDDMEGPAWSILHDDDGPESRSAPSGQAPGETAGNAVDAAQHPAKP
ncbi:MAG TPA: cbb3-type cytochrome oxidase assembly protein CcoS [Burkholderiaceae bacterium]|nr:cbb3-type cytochrome oxidase assembly protein CcoS [Burkholderiaceae bacterium]